MATTIFHNGRFFTATEDSNDASSASHFEECMVIIDDRISYVGPKEDTFVKDSREIGATEVDMEGRIVLPSFIDGHMHLLMFAMALHKLPLDPCKDLSDIRSAITKYAAEHPEVPRILCRGWHQSMTNGEALASMLDELDPRPIFIDAKDLHSTWCNSAALAEMGLDENTPDPEGGTIHRDSATKKPSGLLSEAASLKLCLAHLFQSTPMELKLSMLRDALNTYNAHGYTGIVELAMDPHAWGALLELQKSYAPDPLPLRIAAHWLIHPSGSRGENLAQVNYAIDMFKLYNMTSSPSLRIAGIKLIVDGVVDACTAALHSPYSNGIDPPLLWDSESLTPVVEHASVAGLQCALHAIGDKAITTAISALSKLPKGKDYRHRIEHLELAPPQTGKELAANAITASIQPVHADPTILIAWPGLLGEERAERTFPYKELLDDGAKLALGTDAPTAPHNPFGGMYVGATRKSGRSKESLAARGIDGNTVHGASQKLSVPTLLSAATAGAARASFWDTECGRLQKGLSADFCVVDGLDLNDGEGLLGVKVRETWFKGKRIFEAD